MNRLTLATVGFALVLAASSTSPAMEPIPVAVLNFANQAQGPAGKEWNWLEKGLADLLINDLSIQPGLMLVDREHMQETLSAEGIPITPDMDLARITKIFVKRFKVARLVFGSFRVDGDKVVLNASIIDAYSGQLLRRVQARGASKEVLKLEKALAGRIITALLGKGNAEQISSSLPVWTESLSASKLLYGAIDLYDQGRFKEAWLLARRVWRADANYVDALYWVGRLHYYMLQYRHARRYFEQFVHASPTHARIGDAIMEYLDTYERTSNDSNAVVKAYEDMLERTPPGAQLVNVFSNVGLRTFVRDWLKFQLGYYYIQNTEYGRAIRLVLPTIERKRNCFTSENKSKVMLIKNARTEALNRLGMAIPLVGPWWRCSEELGSQPPRPVLFCRPGMGEVDMVAAFEGWGGKEPWPYGQAIYAGPPGYLFTSATFKADTQPDKRPNLQMGMALENGTSSEPFALRPPVSSNAKSIQWAPTILLTPEVPVYCQAFTTEVNFWNVAQIHTFTLRRNTSAQLSKLTARFELCPKNPDPTGAIEIVSPMHGVFSVHLDGRFFRSRQGMMQGVPVGKHTVRIRTNIVRKEYKEYEVEVLPNQIVRVNHLLETKDKYIALGWSRPIFVAQTTRNPTHRFGVSDRSFFQFVMPRACQLIRSRTGQLVVLWSSEDDISISTSDDLGKTWSSPALLPVPVNSAHLEENPSLGQLPDGRWILLFQSNRYIPRRTVLYACWSWDLKRWSNPRMIFDYSQGRREYEIFPTGRHPLLVWPDGRVGIRAIFTPRNERDWHPALIFYDRSRNAVWHNAAILDEKGRHSHVTIYSFIKDSHDVLHLFCRFSMSGSRHGQTMVYLHGARMNALQKASITDEMAGQNPRPSPFATNDTSLIELDGQVLLTTTYFRGSLSLYKPMVDGTELKPELFAKIPRPPYSRLQPIRIDDATLGFISAGRNAVIFRSLDLTKALGKDSHSETP